MSTTESQSGAPVIALDERLKSDRAGELRDRMVDELRVAAGEIQTALGGEVTAADAAMLRSLLDSVGHGERIVVEVWTAYHGMSHGAASLPG